MLKNGSDHEPLSPAAEAYIWGFPLVSIHRTRQLLCSKNKPATLNHLDNLATPSDRAIVAPNNDTRYSSGWYDLRHGDLVIDIPPMDKPDRYWNVMIADAYTHVTYIARRHHGLYRLLRWRVLCDSKFHESGCHRYRPAGNW